MDHLQRRAGRYYFRQTIPLDLRPWFGGKRELRKSLRTTSYNTAKSSLRCHLYRAERLFTLIRSGMMNTQQIEKLVAAYFTRALGEAEEGRADGVGGLVDSEDGEHGVSSADILSFYLGDLAEAFTKGEHVTAAAHIADEILDGAGIVLDKGSHDYLKLYREAMRGATAAAKVELRRMSGWSPEDGPLAKQDSTGRPGTLAPAKDSGELLSKLIPEYMNECATSKRWRGRTRAEAPGIFGLFIKIVSDGGINTLDRRAFTQFRDILIRYPSNANKKAKYRGKTVAEVLELAGADPRLSTTSVNKILLYVQAFIRWAVRNGYAETNFAEGLSITTRNVSEDAERETYDKGDLLRLVLGLPKESAHPERFWIPLISLYSGARLSEIVQLHLDDITEVGGLPCFDVNDAEGKEVKNASSRRIIPIHPLLLELGFISFVEGLRRARGAVREGASARLWGNLKAHQFGQWFQRFNRKRITTNPKKVFHSFRHSFINSLKQRQVPEDVIKELAGHSLGSITLGRYGKRYEPGILLDALQKIEYGIEEELRAKVSR
jgi:integrase